MPISKSIWHIDKNNSIFREEELAIHVEGKILVNNLYSMISTGTERTVCTGRVATSTYTKMAVPYMEGSFDFPIKYGYSCIGEDLEGNFYHYMHPHQSKTLVEEKDIFKIIRRENIPLFHYALISNMETVINAIWDADLQDEDGIAIVGAGNIGMLLAITIRDFLGKTVDIFEVNFEKEKKARACGFHTEGKGPYSKIFHTSGTESGLNFCIENAAKEGAIIELSWYGDRKVSVQLGGNFHYNRIKLISSQVGTLSPKAPGEITFAKRKQLSKEIIDRCHKFSQLITLIPFSKAVEFFDQLRDETLSGGGPNYIFDYSK